MSVETLKTTLLDIESLFNDDGLTFEERRRLLTNKSATLPARFGKKVEAFGLHYLRQQKVILSTLERIHNLLINRGEIELDLPDDSDLAAENYRRSVSEAYGRFLFTIAVRRDPRGTVLAEWSEGYLILRFCSSVDFHIFYLVEPEQRSLPANFYVLSLPIEFGSERRELPIVAVVHSLTAGVFNDSVDDIIRRERRALLERFLEEEELLEEYRALFAN